MYHDSSPTSGDQGNLRVLEAAAGAPGAAYESDAAVRAAFDAELRKLAEEIVQHHPSLTQLLLSMGPGGQESGPLHGRN